MGRNLSHLFSMEYVQGYTAALQDVLRVISSIQCDLKYHKVRQCYKTYKSIVECMLENRGILREVPDAFIRHNSKTQEFELWIDGVKTEDEKVQKLQDWQADYQP